MNSRHIRLSDIYAGFLVYVATIFPVWLGVNIGVDFISSDNIRADLSRSVFLTACSRIDGKHYLQIVEKGYSYNPTERSTVAFFPVYPIMSWLVIILTGWNATLALLVVSNLMLLGALILFSAFFRSRNPDEPSCNRYLILVLFGLWPTGLFFRMTYSESTFVFFTLLVLLGIVCRWPLPILVFLTGLVTATRPVGLAVAAALCWHVLSDEKRGSVVRRVCLLVIFAPIACWGLLGFMLYQSIQFNAPLAFAQTQKHWGNAGSPDGDLSDKVESLLSGEPIWGAYIADSGRCWWRHETHRNFIFSLFFWNPILFVGAFGLVLYGASKSWLAGPEIVLGLGLLAIPYLTRAYEMSMASHGRFAAVVLPAFIVLGRLLQSGPEWLIWSVVGLLSTLLMAWSALFAAGYLIF